MNAESPPLQPQPHQDTERSLASPRETHRANAIVGDIGMPTLPFYKVRPRCRPNRTVSDSLIASLYTKSNQRLLSAAVSSYSSLSMRRFRFYGAWRGANAPMVRSNRDYRVSGENRGDFLMALTAKDPFKDWNTPE